MNFVFNKYLRTEQLEKLKDLKFWADQNLPDPLKPFISYTLGWLSPDLLGTGFHLISQSDSALVAKIPYNKMNTDFQNQIHTGLVVNASAEMIKLFLAKHFVGFGFQFVNTELSLKKKLSWSSDLILKLNVDLDHLELKMLEMQKHKKSDFEFYLSIATGESKKTDLINYKIEIQKINLLVQE